MSSTLTSIPSVDRLLRHNSFATLIEQYGRTQVSTAIRAHLDDLRKCGAAAGPDLQTLSAVSIAGRLTQTLQAASRSSLQAVFNLTGTVLHTNLGRALLPAAAIDSVALCMRSPVNLEYDLQSGKRGERDTHVESLLRELTGGEAATAVNNNAAAVLLILSALAARREVIVSRGELVEIGGSFRIPDIMRQAGTRLVEVGTTNRTHLHDYTNAISTRTAMLMKVHTSNYAVTGFTSSVSVSELARLAHERSLPLAVDLGSGSLIDMAAWQLPAEPTVQATIAAGADLVAFSGDKLLGGPQAGLLVGRADLIDKLRRHPLKRALRLGKLTLAALEPVLRLYRSPEFLAERLPTLRLLSRPAAQIQVQAERLRPQVAACLGEHYEVTEVPLASQIGSGAVPTQVLVSYGLAIRPVRGRHASLQRLESALRRSSRPILGRLADRTLWLDLRCLEPADEVVFVQQWSMLRI